MPSSPSSIRHVIASRLTDYKTINHIPNAPGNYAKQDAEASAGKRSAGCFLEVVRVW